MIYTRAEYALLLLGTVALFRLCRRSWHARSTALLGASLLFYAWAGAFDLLVFLAVVAVSWSGTWIARRWPRARGPALAGSILVLLLHLAFWKYLPWLARLATGRGVELPLPIGVSFVTLQGISYLVDLRRGRARFLSARSYLLCKSFFPQLLAGPIARMSGLAPQLRRLRGATSAQAARGLSLIALGFAKKLCVAEALAPEVGRVFAEPAAFGRSSLLAALLYYSIQIYADFSGYTDIGRGSALLLGVRLPENFRSPYLAGSLREFWRRWHVTLGAWFRDYVYVPLGGNRGPWLRRLAVLLLTFALSGLWHGADAVFLVWGVYHGVLLAAERGLARLSGARRPPGALGVLWVNAAVCGGWMIFRSGSLGELARYLHALAQGPGNGRIDLAGFIPVAAGLALQTLSLERPLAWVLRSARRGELRPALAWGGLLAALLVAALYLRTERVSPEFIYFRF